MPLSFTDWAENSVLRGVHSAPNAIEIESSIAYTNCNCFNIKLSHPVFTFLIKNDSISVPETISGSLLPAVQLAPVCMPIQSHSSKRSMNSTVQFHLPSDKIGLSTADIREEDISMKVEWESSVVDLTLDSPIKIKGSRFVGLTQSPLPPAPQKHHRSPSIIEISDIDVMAEVFHSAGVSDDGWSTSDTELPDPCQLWGSTALLETLHKHTTSSSRKFGKEEPKGEKETSPSTLSKSNPRIHSRQPLHPSAKQGQPELQSHRSNYLPPGAPVVGATYDTLEKAKAAIIAYEEARGFKMCMGQSKRTGIQSGNMIKKLVMQCHSYGKPGYTHDMKIDPSDYRQGHSVKTECSCHYNLNRIGHTEMFTLTLADYEHNHGRNLAVGAAAPRPPTAEEQHIVDQYARDHTFRQIQIDTVLRQVVPNHHLSSRQTSNIINEARESARKDIQDLGGDFAAIVQNLQEKEARGQGWVYRLKLDGALVVGIFCLSPEQA
ncbi:hypothetical protein M422DRAFT_270714 [Sphaerobolus stellatus SS14]|uniref:FAR1 domain-containing protein n=1 Tax=Sphaerobolus stellatus (strain SS14) TaxID=990650 RepID=A0A0C9US40_SPHS4|nr:hypothetical protein M422DRAFT_270714 [Sphaerobolus stellatus SS14]